MKVMDKLAAVAALHGDGTRLALTDAEAVELVNTPGIKLTFAAQAVSAAKDMASLLAETPDVSNADALEVWALSKRTVSLRLWDALNGQVVNGIEILRKQA